MKYVLKHKSQMEHFQRSFKTYKNLGIGFNIT